MTSLSININKLALIRNSREGDYPNLTYFVDKLIQLGVNGITVHPRPDQRHIRYTDIAILHDLLLNHQNIEFNIEGYPSDEFIKLVLANRPDQVTLVPDNPSQLTSDHGWNALDSADLLIRSCQIFKDAGIRVSLFMDANERQIEALNGVDADRIELYTGPFAAEYSFKQEDANLSHYIKACKVAADLGLQINAGHDLNLNNLEFFLTSLKIVDEVSIGHAFTVESIEYGLDHVIQAYLSICNALPN